MWTQPWKMVYRKVSYQSLFLIFNSRASKTYADFFVYFCTFMIGLPSLGDNEAQLTSYSVPFSEYKTDIVGVALFMEDEQLERGHLLYLLFINSLFSSLFPPAVILMFFIVLKAMFLRFQLFFSYSYWNSLRMIIIFLSSCYVKL